MPRRIAAHLKANVVAYIALFFALGVGTAWALERNSVRSKHIKDTNVREADLGPGAVTPGKLGLIERNRLGGTTSTTSTTPVDTSQAGPIATVTITNDDSLVAIYAEADIDNNGGGCRVHLVGDSLPNPPPSIMFSTDSSFTRMHTAPSSNGAGTNAASDAGWIVMREAAGTHTYQLRYSAQVPTPNCSFTNRDLYVAVLG